MSDNEHGSEETVDETAARVDVAPATETATEDETAEVDQTDADKSVAPERRTDWSGILAYGLLPAVAFLLVIGAAVLKFLDSGVRESDAARAESVQAAKDSAVALLSYKPDTVEQQLTAARERLTGDFRDEYSDLTNDIVIPGARQKQISAVASVPAAASVSADPGSAVVLLFINQTVTVGAGAPTDTASSVRVTLDKVDDRWLISQFEPV